MKVQNPIPGEINEISHCVSCLVGVCRQTSMFKVYRTDKVSRVVISVKIKTEKSYISRGSFITIIYHNTTSVRHLPRFVPLPSLSFH